MNQRGLIYLIIVPLFFLMAGVTLLTTGMPFEGLLCHNMAANIAEGRCTLWDLSHSPSLYPEYQGQLPLGMGMVAAYLALFGTSLAAYRSYCMVMVMLCFLAMLRLWRRLGYEAATGWLPMGLMLLMLDVPYSSTFDALGWTQLFLVLHGFLLMLRYDKTRKTRVLFQCLSGFFLFLAFLSDEGSVTFLLFTPLLIWLSGKIFKYGADPKRRLPTYNFGEAIFYTAVPLLTFSILLGVLLLFPAPRHGFCGVMAGVRWTDPFAYGPSRAKNAGLILNTVYSTMPAWGSAVTAMIVAALLRAFSRPKQHGYNISRRAVRQFVLLIGLVLIGTLFILLRNHTSADDLLVVYPFFATALAVLLNDTVERWFSKTGREFGIVAQMLAFVLAGSATVLNSVQYGKPQRDVEMQLAMREFAPLLKVGETVTIADSLPQQDLMQAYYYREMRVDLSPAYPGQPLRKHLIAGGAAAEVPRYDLTNEMPGYCLYTLKPASADSTAADNPAAAVTPQENNKEPKIL